LEEIKISRLKKRFFAASYRESLASERE